MYAGGGDYDDLNHPEVGAVGLGDYNQDGDYNDVPTDLRYAVASARAFYYWLYYRGWNNQQTFFFTDDYTYERDFKRDDGAYGGEDFKFADYVDICWFQGHSAPVWADHQALDLIAAEENGDTLLEWFGGKVGRLRFRMDVSSHVLDS